jgi:hypothetical protein
MDRGQGDVSRNGLRGGGSFFGSTRRHARVLGGVLAAWEVTMNTTVWSDGGVGRVEIAGPYRGRALRKYRDKVYNHDSLTLAADVRNWCVAHGAEPRLRIALCGYEGEHPMPISWECVPWKARGGYGSQADGRGRENSARERIWFSPACIQQTDQLFPA